MKVAHAAAGDPEIPVPTVVVAIAPITDLEAGYEQKLSDEGDAVELYMKATPSAAPEHYAAASPIKLLPVATRTVLIAGAVDTDVPVGHIRPYAAAAAVAMADGAGSDASVAFHEIPDADHWVLVDVAGPVWPIIIAELEASFRSPLQSRQAPAAASTLAPT